MSISLQQGKTINFEKALEFPLSPIPLSLCNADGSLRKTNKSQLLKKILEMQNPNIQFAQDSVNTVFIIDLMALVRTISSIPETFEDLAARIFKSIPTGFKELKSLPILTFRIQLKALREMREVKRTMFW